MTSKILLEQYMAERHALGFSLKTDEGCIRRFLRDFAEPDDGVISFTKDCLPEYDAVNGLLCVSLLSCPRISCIA